MITAAHTSVDYPMVIKNAKWVFDTKNVTKKVNCTKSNVVLL